MSSKPSRTLETFSNPSPQNDYLIHMEMPEFTCLCPKTGQPDFAHLLLDYIPEQDNIELKSLKMYLWSFRNEGAFHEAVTNLILQDIVQTCQPRFARLLARWYVRGGIYTHVLVEHRQPQWQPSITIPPVHFNTHTPTQP